MPDLLDDAAEDEDNKVQYQKVVTLFIAGINNFLNLKQPLNPILGETFNGFLGNAQVCLEQISHHPPVSAYYMKSKIFLFFNWFSINFVFEIKYLIFQPKSGLHMDKLS